IFCEFYDVTEGGNFEHGKSILHRSQSVEQFSAATGRDVDKVRAAIASGRKRLFNVREERVRPGRDEKSLAAWDGLMLPAFSEAANILGRDDYKQVAIRNANFLAEHLIKDGRLLRTYKSGRSKLNGYLEDYAYVLEGMLALYEATFDMKYFDLAKSLADAMI